jgi:hypothetical protein
MGNAKLSNRLISWQTARVDTMRFSGKRVYQDLSVTSGLPVARAELFIFLPVLHFALSELRLKSPPLPSRIGQHLRRFCGLRRSQ